MPDNPWHILYETEQTFTREDGLVVKAHFATHAKTQRAAMISAHVAFVEQLHVAGIRHKPRLGDIEFP